MKTRFDYTVNGKSHSVTVATPSVLAYNAKVDKLLPIADKDSIRATTV